MTKMITPVNTFNNIRIFFVLDRSGSMQSIKNDTIGGYNAFIEEQKNIAAEATFSLIQFDTQYEVHIDRMNIQEVPLMTDFHPRGSTALYDAIGLTINNNQEAPEDTKTIVAILTDGEENASKEYDYLNVKSVIENAQNKGWEIIFIGANMNAKHVASNIGIKMSNVATFDFNSKGATDAMRSVSKATSAYRGMNTEYMSASGTVMTMNSTNVDLSVLYESEKKTKRNKN